MHCVIASISHITILHYLINTFLVPDIHFGVVFLPLSGLSLMLQCRLWCPKVPRCLHDVLRNVWVYVSEMHKVDVDYLATAAYHTAVYGRSKLQSAKCHVQAALQVSGAYYVLTSKWSISPVHHTGSISHSSQYLQVQMFICKSNKAANAIVDW